MTDKKFDYASLYKRLMLTKLVQRDVKVHEVDGLTIELPSKWANLGERSPVVVKKVIPLPVGSKYVPKDRRKVEKIVEFFEDGSVWVVQPRLLEHAQTVLMSLTNQLEKE